MSAYEAILAQAPAFMAPDGVLALEIGDGRHEALRLLTKNQPCWISVETKTDLAGRPRVLTARLRDA